MKNLTVTSNNSETASKSKRNALKKLGSNVKTLQKGRKACTRPIKGRSYFVGHEKVYSHQDSMAQEILALLRENERAGILYKRCPIALMQPQCGKTGVIIALVNAFIDDCKKLGQPFQVIVISALSHNDLRDQTKGRLFRKSSGKKVSGADLDMKARATNLATYPEQYQDLVNSGVMVTNNTPVLRRMDLNVSDVRVRRLVVVDEVHLGNVKDGNLDIFLRKHGIFLNEQYRLWDNSNASNWFVGVSATPFAHMIMSENAEYLDGEAIFRWFYREPPSNYNSISRMLTNGRLQPTEDLFHKSGAPTAFYQKVIDAFIASCKAKGPGYLVIRATGKKHKQLIRYLNRTGRLTECQQFDTQKGNLDQLNTALSVKPKAPVIVAIRGCMRAGITLPLDHHIRGWVETESGASDTQVQAGVGRACGYGRDRDIYPIYCDLDHVKECIKLYNSVPTGVSCIPSGTQSRRTKTRDQYPILEVMDSYDAAWKKHVEPHKKSGYRHQISKTSGNVYNDVCAMLMAGTRDSGSTDGYHVDGPPSEANMEEFIARRLGKGAHKNTTADEVRGWHKRNLSSYRKLIRLHPEWKGKVVIFDTSKTVEAVSEGQSRNDLQKNTSALKS